MSDYANILVDVEGPVATITLNRPEKLNALSEALRDDLAAALRELNPGDSVRVIRIKGAGRAFCAGYDITPNDNDFDFTPSARRGRSGVGAGRVECGDESRAFAGLDGSVVVDLVVPQADCGSGARLVFGGRQRFGGLV